MHQAIQIIRFKLEGQIIKRHPEYEMDDRQLLEQIDFQAGTLEQNGKVYALNDTNFPTVSREDPCRLTAEEAALMDDLRESFLHCEKLQKHIRFLFEKGNFYKQHNGNLLFHSCVPMKADGTFDSLPFWARNYQGKSCLIPQNTLSGKVTFSPGQPAERIRS